MRYHICFLGYGRLIEIAEEAVAGVSYDDTEIKIAECNVDNLNFQVNTAIAQGYEVFIAGFANAAEFVRTINRNLVEIRIGYIDYVNALKKALEIGRKPVFAVYRHSRWIDLSPISDMLNLEIQIIRYEDGEELYTKIKSCSGDVIIGASHANQVAESAGKKSVLLAPGIESVRNAIERARALAIDLENEKINNAILRAIINNSTFGLIVSNEQNQITMFNNEAQKLTGISARESRGKDMDQIFPTLNTDRVLSRQTDRLEEYHLINESMFRCTQNSILVSGKCIGVLTILNADNRSRKFNHNRAQSLGSVARTTFDLLGYSSAAMSKAITDAKNLAATSHNIILIGEESSGREMFAQCIHNASINKDGPYVRIDLSSLGSSDPGKFLLGYDESGQHYPGLIEQANNGTAVAENFSDAYPNAVSILLNAVTSQQIQPLGSDRIIPLNLRMIAITTVRDLNTMNPARRSRLGSFMIEIPPLRKCKEDIPNIFLRYLNRISDIKIRPKSITVPMQNLLKFYSWPGNLSELAVTAERYLFQASASPKTTPSMRYKSLVSSIGEENIMKDLLSTYPVLTEKSPSDLSDFRKAVNVVKQMLGYNNDTIAEKIGISRTTLWRLMKEE